MAQTNVQLIQGLYEAFGRGDAGAVLAAFDSQIIWNEAENFAYADLNPYVGPQKVAEGVFGRILTEWDGFTVTPQHFVAEGEAVVALGRYRGTFKATAAPVDAQFVHAWTIRGGKVAAFQQYTDTLQFAKAMNAAVA